MASRILLNPTRSDILSSRVFTTLAIEEIYDIFIVQQCYMLQSHTGIDCVSRCLDNVSETVKSLREEILKADYDALLKSQSQHLSTKFVAEVARSSSWRQLWDLALDKGTKGTTIMQLLFKELSRPKFGDNCCNVCNAPTVSDLNCLNMQSCSTRTWSELTLLNMISSPQSLQTRATLFSIIFNSFRTARLYDKSHEGH